MNVPISQCRLINSLYLLLLLMGVLAMFPMMAWADPAKPNSITFENLSGRNAVVRIIGPTKAIAKMQRDETRIVHVSAGDYYILVRYGDSKKEYSYTRSAVFPVTQSENKFSVIRFTLHRRSGGTFNSQPVSGNEFETSVYSKSHPLSP